MECPKCHRNISDDATSCPYCHKVLSLVCPNCRSIGHSTVCEKCGYIILERCSKCGKKISTTQKKCKCGFPIQTSIAYNECESDEFASIRVEFGGLKAIRRTLSSHELYNKFKLKLKNLLISQLKSLDGNVILYGDIYVINFNKDLSFPTSSNKAVRTALKIVSSFTSLNLKVQEELGTSLKLNLTIFKKSAEELLEDKKYTANVKPLILSKDEKKYLKGTQIIIDEYVQDVINKDYKTDSIYTIEQDGKTIVFYEIKIGNYILPPNENRDVVEEQIAPIEIIDPAEEKENQTEEKSLYDFNIFNLNAKCSFEKSYANDIWNKLDTHKIIAIRGNTNLHIQTSDLVKHYSDNGKKVICIHLSEELNYKPWGVLEDIYRQYYGLSINNSMIPSDYKDSYFTDIANLMFCTSRKASTPEDARFGYMDDFVRFLGIIKNSVLIFDNFIKIDDTTKQVLELYFDNYKQVKNNFVFITDEDNPIHSKIKSLLRTNIYKEIFLQKNTIENYLQDLQEEASDFINSFYYDKIKSNFNGSKLYFDTAIQYLKEKDVLLSFENRLLVKNNDSVFLSTELEDITKSRLKLLSKFPEASTILAYLVLLGSRLDFSLIEKLEINDYKKNIDLLIERGFIYVNNNYIYLNNFSLMSQVILSSLKKNVLEFLTKNILSKIANGMDNTTIIFMMGKLGLYKDEYLLLWKNSVFAIETGDYDSYLKNTIGFMSLIKYIKGDISNKEIEEHKLKVYENILRSLYAYSPEKIYDIEQILLADAVKNDDVENTIKLSNLMLQGALISGKYGEASGLLNNILRNMPNPTLVTNGVINTKFFLLSLVNIEILFNLGDLATCIDISNDLISVMKPDIIEKIKPASFSINLFVGHIMDTLRLGALAHILSLNKNLSTYLTNIEKALGDSLPEKNLLLSLESFLAGNSYSSINLEKATPFAKIIYLLMQEFSEDLNDNKTFAQNIYQAKLLASDINQSTIEIFCEILISFAYSKAGIFKKSEAIYKDIIDKTEKSANINIMLFAKYFYAKLKVLKGEIEGSLLIINDAISYIRENAESETLLLALFKYLLINIAEQNHLSFINIDEEYSKLQNIIPNGELKRIITLKLEVTEE